MTVVKVTSDNFRDEVMNSEVPVVVDFYADWCGPCHQIAPILNMLSEQHQGVVKFTKVNVDEEPDLARAYRVSSMPAVLLFEKGAPTAWSLGAKPGYVLERELGLARLSKKAKRGGKNDLHDEDRQEEGLLATLKSWRKRK